MVNQINLSVHVAAIGQSINFTVPVMLEVKDSIQLMMELIMKEFIGVRFSDMPVLVDVASQSQLEGALRIEDLPLFNGSKLLLI